MTCPGIWLRAAVAALTISDVSAPMAFSSNLDYCRSVAIGNIANRVRYESVDKRRIGPKSLCATGRTAAPGHRRGQAHPRHADAVHHHPEPGIRACPADMRQGAT